MDKVVGSYRYVTELHRSDELGRPAGGKTTGVGIDIVWQNGPLRVDDPFTPGRFTIHPPNGAFVEGVLEAALGRLEFYQQSEFRCRENALAITKIEEALHWLQARTADRTERGVEGTHQL